jgi:hypothetical protein
MAQELPGEVTEKILLDGIKSERLSYLDVLSYFKTHAYAEAQNTNDFWRRVFNVVHGKSASVAAQVAIQTYGTNVNWLQYLLADKAMSALYNKDRVEFVKNRPDNNIPVYLRFQASPQGVLYSDYTYKNLIDTDPVVTRLYNTIGFFNLNDFEGAPRIFWSRSVKSDGFNILYRLLSDGWYIEQPEPGRTRRYIHNCIECAVPVGTECSACGTVLCESCVSDHQCQ